MRITKNLFFTSFLVLLSFVNSCHTKTEKKDTPNKIKTKNIAPKTTQKTAILFEQKCMICHITKGKTSETMLAPPFYEIKKRYLKASMGKADFIEIMSDWVKNPSPDNVLIPNAVKHFSIMPNLNYTEKEINQIIPYIYNTDLPKPDWFDAHEKEHLKELVK